MPKFATSVFFVVAMAGIANSQPVSQSILHHIDVVALSNGEYGRGRGMCSFVTNNATRSTFYNASAFAPACEGRGNPSIWKLQPHDTLMYTPDFNTAEFTNTSFFS